MKKQSDDDKVKQFNAWLVDAVWASRQWRKEAWRDCEMYDGGDAQWSQADWDAAIAAGLDIVTINRTFPVVNLILGAETINQADIAARGRTHKDSEISQVMSEGIKFVLDQNSGEYLISDAFRDQVVPGIGWVAPGLNSDPRKERIGLRGLDWKEVGWDPFVSPWAGPSVCRYKYVSRWVDKDALMFMFPNKKKEIESVCDKFWGDSWQDAGRQDEADLVEEEISILSGSYWAKNDRKRVRPCEMWYPVDDRAYFAVFPDGRVFEISDNMDPVKQYELITQAQEVMLAPIKRMRVARFLGELLLDDSESPMSHDEFPIVPFVGYLDRFNMPFGVPRQIRGQDEEVNKRRSMALALLRKRRVTAEESVAGDQRGLDRVYQEANKMDGLIVVKDGRLDDVRIEEMASLSPAQHAILEQSEKEIQQISGEMVEYPRRIESGKAMERVDHKVAQITAPLMRNYRRSLKMIGEQIGANIQGEWQYEKVLRITDRLTGAERFVALNEMVQGEDGTIEVKNNITQGKFDYVVTEVPATDTVREQNLNLISEWVKRAPPEIIPSLVMLGLKMSNLPDKEQLLAAVRPLLNVDPRDDDKSPEQLKQEAIEKIEAQQKAAAEQAQVEQNAVMLELEQKKAEIEETYAKVQKLLADAEKKAADIERDVEKGQLEGFKTGLEAGKIAKGESEQVGRS